MALAFGWFLSYRLGSFSDESYAERMRRSEAIENWSSVSRASPPALPQQRSSSS